MLIKKLNNLLNSPPKFSKSGAVHTTTTTTTINTINNNDDDKIKLWYFYMNK